MQNKNGFNRLIHDLVYGASVKDAVKHVVVVFNHTKDVGFIVDNEIHNAVSCAAVANVIKLQGDRFEIVFQQPFSRYSRGNV